MLVGDQGAADARAAAELVVGGLAAGLPASEEGGVDGLLRMLHSEGCWAALDALASGPGLPL